MSFDYEDNEIYHKLLDEIQDTWDSYSSEEKHLVDTILKDAAQLTYESVFMGAEYAKRESMHLESQLLNLGEITRHHVKKVILNTVTNYLTKIATSLIVGIL